MVYNIDPIVPEGTPLPTPPVGVPPYPITPFAVWTWDSPVIPSFYWNVYSAEQRVKMICKEIGKIEAYLNYLVNKTNENFIALQGQITKLDTRLTSLEKKLEEEVARLDALIAKLREDLTAEAKARQDGDEALDSRITSESTKLHGEISTETQNRIHADDELHGEITAETQARIHADDILHKEISDEKTAREEADTELNAALTKETSDRKAADDAIGKRIDATDAANARVASDLAAEVKAREAGDTALQGKLDAETSAREAADADLQSKITAETTARGEAISALTTRVATEESTRQAEDGKLGARIDEANAKIQNNASAIVTEKEARTAADAAINQSLATKLERNDLKAAGKITLTPGEGNTITIGDSFEADFKKLEDAISGLQASLASETDERRHDDQSLQTAVEARLERGKLLAGDGIEVVNDPDQSTVTVSAKVTETALSAVEAKAEAATTTAGEAKTTAEAASTAAAGAESKAEQALTAAQGSLKSVAHTASLTGDGTSSTPLALTPATATTLGGVKVGSGLAVTSDGVLSATSQGGSGGSYTLPVATAETLGGVKIGVGLAVEDDGTLSTTEDTHDGEGEESTAVGDSASATGSDSTALGKDAIAEGNDSLALGYSARGTGQSSVAIGSYSSATEAETVSFGTGNQVLRGPKTRRLVNITDPVNPQDAATKAYVDAYSGGTGLTEVAHDNTLKGAGTAGSPLGVSLYPFGGLQTDSKGISIHAGEGLWLNADNNSINSYVTQSKLDAVDSKATEAKTAAQEAKTAVDGKLSTVSVSGPITGNGTASSPLNVETGVGLTVSSGKLVSTVHSIGVAVVRCNIDSFSLAKGESKTVSKDFAGIQGRVSVHGLSGEGHLIAVIPDTSANANLAGAVASVRVNGSSSGDGTYTITKVTATIYAAANELQNINSFGITLLFSDTSSYASYQEIPKAS